MRGVFLVVAAALLLAGCDGISSSWDVSERPSPTDAPVVDPPDAARNTYCEATARSRAEDATGQGFDEAVQQTVYRETYTDCVRWAARK